MLHRLPERDLARSRHDAPQDASCQGGSLRLQKSDACLKEMAVLGSQVQIEVEYSSLKRSGLAAFCPGQCRTSDLVESSPSWTDQNVEFDAADLCT